MTRLGEMCLRLYDVSIEPKNKLPKRVDDARMEIDRPVPQRSLHGKDQESSQRRQVRDDVQKRPPVEVAVEQVISSEPKVHPSRAAQIQAAVASALPSAPPTRHLQQHDDRRRSFPNADRVGHHGRHGDKTRTPNDRSRRTSGDLKIEEQNRLPDRQATMDIVPSERSRGSQGRIEVHPSRQALLPPSNSPPPPERIDDRRRVSPPRLEPAPEFKSHESRSYEGRSLSRSRDEHSEKRVRSPSGHGPSPNDPPSASHRTLPGRGEPLSRSNSSTHLQNSRSRSRAGSPGGGPSAHPRPLPPRESGHLYGKNTRDEKRHATGSSRDHRRDGDGTGSRFDRPMNEERVGPLSPGVPGHAPFPNAIPIRKDPPRIDSYRPSEPSARPDVSDESGRPPGEVTRHSSYSGHNDRRGNFPAASSSSGPRRDYPNSRPQEPHYQGPPPPQHFPLPPVPPHIPPRVGHRPGPSTRHPPQSDHPYRDQHARNGFR
ncbi:hypothetical protein DFS34DRAFT_155039 [Phlyctochytrium arcticum]|nr:hypothetical protein DFS34DRAFT_155039 [Phlyctochytrium arcticum]